MSTPRSIPTTKHARERGVALLLVMFAVAIAAVLALTFVSRQSTTLGIRENVDRHGRARAIAESAMQLAVKSLHDNPAWRTDGTAADWENGSAWTAFDLGDGLPAGSYRIHLADLPDDLALPFDLAAEGRWDGAVARVETTVTPVPRIGPLLMIVKTLPLTDPADLRMKDMFESWGWTVQLLAQSASQATMEAQAENAGTVFISTSVDSGTVGTKLNAATAGAVTTETQLNDEWGLSSGYIDSLAATDAVRVLDSSHEIMNPFGGGSLILTEKPQKLRFMTGTFASEADWLARHTSHSAYRAIGALEVGAADLHGDAAPGRRVILPWSTNADPSWLTADGQDLIRRALEWASVTPELRPFGVATREYVRLHNTSRIDASEPNAYSPTTHAAGLALVATNGAGDDAVGVYSNATMNADVYAGPGADLDDAIAVDATAEFLGSKNGLYAPITFDTITRPSGWGLPVDGTYVVDTGKTQIIPGIIYDMEDFIVRGGGTLRMWGNVVVRCRGELIIEGNVRIDVPANASLTIYAKKLTIRDNVNVNMIGSGNFHAERVNLYMDGSNPLRIEGGAKVAASVHGPNSPMEVAGSARFFGRFVGRRLAMESTARFTQDLSLGQPAAGTGGATLAPTYRYVPRWSDRR